MKKTDVVNEDAVKLLVYMDAKGLDASAQTTRGEQHMGALIVDSVMQRQLRYETVVAPRVTALRDAWPDAHTTDGFLLHMENRGLSDVFHWPSREEQMLSTAKLFHAFGIQTVVQLRDYLADEEARQELRTELRKIRNIGPKTLDYFDILCGLNSTTAVDSRIRRAAKRADIESTDYGHLVAVLRAAANRRGWRVGDLDALLWATHSN